MSRRHRLRETFLPEFDATLASIVVGSTLLVVAAAVVQVRYGSFDMPLETAVRALFDQAVWTDLHVFATLVLGEDVARTVGLYSDLGHLTDATIIVWTVRLPRVVVAAFVGLNLAVSGAVL